jgi:UDP-glucuronate 4-epimerase
MKALVTGAAGFIGSNLADYLVAQDIEVIGIDSFTTHYDPRFKRLNLYELSHNEKFTLVEKDLALISQDDLTDLLEKVDIVFHLAARAGVRSSWGSEFVPYLSDNILATQKLLEALKWVPRKLIYAGTSSVYGDGPIPFNVNQKTEPVSPYGVTKLAAEDLIRLYGRWHDVPFTIMRLFNVYGPRQRPDMAFGRIIMAGIADKPFSLWGSVKREFTYVEDVCAALQDAYIYGEVGKTYNVSGGAVISMDEAVRLIEKELGKEINILRSPGIKGDATVTKAAVGDITKDLHWQSDTLLKDGIRKQVRWVKENLNQASYYLNEV